MTRSAWISTEPIDLAAMLASVDAPEHGAVASFVGQVRDHDPEAEGEVVALRYTCHPDAQTFIEDVVTRTVAEHDPEGTTDVTATHRIGDLEVGDLALVVGTPLDFRLGYGSFGGHGGAPDARVVHVTDSPGQISTHADPAASAAGDLTAFFDLVQTAVEQRGHTDWSEWAGRLADESAARAAASVGVPARCAATQPSMLRWRPRATAS